jgi:glycosyltransferase involved in cell wall biosynthesis
VVLDTDENLALLSATQRSKGVVAPVGAGSAWFHAPVAGPQTGPLRVVFFGMYTPLQGAPVIGDAISQLPPTTAIGVTMVGSGQDYVQTRELAGEDPRVTWLDWVAADELPALVTAHDVCLGIFGSAGKATRVVPTKVFQGAAAGCAIVTSATRPQVRTLGDAALFVPPGDAAALAALLIQLSEDRDKVMEMRRRAYSLAQRSFDPVHATGPLVEVLRSRLGEETP